MQTSSGQMQTRAMLLLNSVDLPARAILLNMKQFNDQHARCYCEDQGDTPPTNHLHRFWPPSGSPVLRTHLSLMTNAKDALSDGNAVCLLASYMCVSQYLTGLYLVCTQVKGVKGPSILAISPSF